MRDTNSLIRIWVCPCVFIRILFAFVCLFVCLEALPNNEAVAIEFNLWTKPDCAGTEYENLNRSWFFFSIQGKIAFFIRSSIAGQYNKMIIVSLPAIFCKQ